MRSKFWLALAVAGLVGLSALAGRAGAAVTRSISSSGTVVMPAGTTPVGGPTATNLFDEIAGMDMEADEDGADDEGDGGVDRTIVTAPGHSVSANAGKKAKSNPELGKSWQGLGFFDQRFANGGNQFSVEPPDQGLCVGNGYVVESTNDVIRVYGTDGTAKTGVVDLNTFYGYSAAIDRATGVRGASITDPICYYDQAANRFVEVVLTLDVVPSGPFGGQNTGPNHFDIAVSNTGDPTGSWTVYKIPTQNDGTQGTPDHGCRAGSPLATWRTNPRACLADYPHIGADRNGIYITSNEFEFFNNGFVGADVYALSKAQLFGGASTLNVWEQSTNGLGPDGAGFTVWPATTPGSQYSDDANGTEYFLSSRAVFSDDGTSSSVLAWGLTNTASLNTASPALNLSVVNVPSQEYAVPGRSAQKPGSLPLMECLNTVSGCYAATGGVPHGTEVMSRLDSNDSRFTGVAYANGKLWGALGTAVDTGTGPLAGIGWFVLKPSATAGGVAASLAKQGIVAGDSVNYTYPSVAVTPSGRGVMGFTIVGPNDFPSAGYAGLDANLGAGDIHVAAAGAGPQDGFSGYQAFRGTRSSARPRWGDYGAAVVDGKSIWLASEYIAQTCTLTQYLATPFGTCSNTRGALGNWSTRISQVTP
jgi:hypothetical protein